VSSSSFGTARAWRLRIVCAAVLALGACSASAGAPPALPRSLPAAQPSHTVTPRVVQTGDGAQWYYFQVPYGAAPTSFAIGPDNAVWAVGGQGLDRISNSGTVTRFPISSPSCIFAPTSLAVGADRRFYVGSGNCGKIAAADLTGHYVTYNTPSGDIPNQGFVRGPDGNVWFVESSHVGKITPAGSITEYPYPSGTTTNSYGAIAIGADGNLWLTENRSRGTALVDKVQPSTGTITEYLVDPKTCAFPTSLITAADRTLYVSCDGTSIARLKTDGTIKILYAAMTGPYPQAMSGAIPGTIWFLQPGQGTYPLASLESLDLSNGGISNWGNPGRFSSPAALVVGPDGNIWTGGDLGYAVLVRNPITLSPTSVQFGGPGEKALLLVTYAGGGFLKVTSGNTSVATVSRGTKKQTFVVTSVGAGTTAIKVSASRLNYVNVSVTVL
jgi:streptogramin lyase